MNNLAPMDFVIWTEDILYWACFEVSSHVVKKNNRDIFRNAKTGRMFPGKSNKLKSAEEFLTYSFKKYGLATIENFVNVKMLFYFDESVFYTKKGEINKKLPDLSNLYQLPEDCLQTAGVLKDDHYIASHDGSRRLPWKSGNWLAVIITKGDDWKSK